MRLSGLLIACACLLQQMASAQAASMASAQTPLNSTSRSELVVTARLTPHCVRMPNDPLDDLTAKAPRGRWVWIEPDTGGSGFRYMFSMPNSSKAPYTTEPGQWRRAGNALPTYIFTQPTDGTPLCIGKRRPHVLPDDSDADAEDVIVVTAKVKSQLTGGQLQQLIRSGPYICRSVRLTINIATRGAVGLLWLNGGFGKWKGYDLKGTRGWTTVILEDGPVGWWYPWAGFGVEVARGDVWIDQTKFEIIPDTMLSAGQRDAERRCRSHELTVPRPGDGSLRSQ